MKMGYMSRLEQFVYSFFLARIWVFIVITLYNFFLHTHQYFLHFISLQHLLGQWWGRTCGSGQEMSHLILPTPLKGTHDKYCMDGQEQRLNSPES